MCWAGSARSGCCSPSPSECFPSRKVRGLWEGGDGEKETFSQTKTKLNSVRDQNEKFPQKLHFGEEAFPVGLILHKSFGQMLSLRAICDVCLLLLYPHPTPGSCTQSSLAHQGGLEAPCCPPTHGAGLAQWEQHPGEQVAVNPSWIYPAGLRRWIFHLKWPMIERLLGQ